MDRQRIFLIVFTGMLVLTGGVIYFGFLRAPGPSAPVGFGPLPILPINPEEILREEDLAVLDDPRLNGLAGPPGPPVTAPTAGRSNPFAPF